MPLPKDAPVALGALLFAGIADVSIRYDNFINPEIVQTLKENWDSSRMFTNGHWTTAYAQLHPWRVQEVCGAAGAALGALSAATSERPCRDVVRVVLGVR